MDEKEVAFYWLKLQKDFFKRNEIEILRAQDNGDSYCVIYMSLMLESLEMGGYLRLSEEIAYDEKMLAAITRENVDVVRSALVALRALKLIEIFDDGTIFLPEVAKEIGSCANNSNANRQRRYRERQKEKQLSQSNDNFSKLGESVTKSNASVTQSVTERNVEYRDYNIDSRDNIKERKKKKERQETGVTPEGSLIIPPTLEEVKSFVIDRGSSVNAVRFYNYYRARNWIVNGVTIVDWRALLIAWEENQKNYARTPEPTQKEYEYLQNDYSRKEIDSLVGDPLADLAQIMECAT